MAETRRYWQVKEDAKAHHVPSVPPQFRRHYLLGEIWNIFADANNLKAQVQLSSLAKAMRDQGKLALVRFVRKENAEPKIGILYPVLRVPDESSADYFHFSEVPFSEDLKRYTFPSLDRVITADGRELKEHRSLPTDSMVRAMEGLVDSMDLMHAFKDEEGEDQPWFSTEDSFNPAIHRMKEAVAYRVMHPDSTDLPRPHWEVDKFLDRPEEIREASRHWAEKCRNLFNIRYYPDKASIKARMKRERDLAEKTRRLEGRHELDLAQAGEDDEEADARSEGAGRAQSQDTQEHKRFKSSNGQSQATQGKLIDSDSDSGTEDEEEELLAPSSSRLASSSREQSVKKEPLSQTQTQAQSQAGASRAVAVGPGEDSDEDEEPQPEIRILTADPVGSFQFYLEDPKMDQGAVIRALQKTIVELVVSGDDAGAGKAKDALRAGKKAAAEYDEAQEWNLWMRRFKARLVSSAPADDGEDTEGEGAVQDQSATLALQRLSATAHGSFWEEHIMGDTEIGLITRDEDESGRSRVTEDEARDVSDPFCWLTARRAGPKEAHEAETDTDFLSFPSHSPSQPYSSWKPDDRQKETAPCRVERLPWTEHVSHVPYAIPNQVQAAPYHEITSEAGARDDCVRVQAGGGGKAGRSKDAWVRLGARDAAERSSDSTRFDFESKGCTVAHQAVNARL